MIPQYQLLGTWMEVHLLVYPTLRWAQAPSRARGGGCIDSFFFSCPCTFLLAISRTRSGAMTSATLSRALRSAEAQC